ncbi:hypothetical protein ACJX0J_034167, partial [Zea mays]
MNKKKVGHVIEVGHVGYKIWIATEPDRVYPQFIYPQFIDFTISMWICILSLDMKREAKQHTNMYPKVMNQGSIMHPLVKAQHTLMIPAQNPGLVPDILSMFHIFFPFMNVALNFLA